MKMTLLKLQVLNLVIIVLHHFSQPVCIVIWLKLINNVRMTTFTHQLFARKNQHQKSDNASANMPDEVLQFPSLCCAWAMQKSFSFNQTES